MKSRFLLLWPVLLVAFNFLFWNEAPGLNMLLFAVLVMIALFIRYPVAWRRRTVQLSGACTLLCGIMVTLYGAGWGVFATIFSLAAFAVFVMEPAFRSVSGAALQFTINIFTWMIASGDNSNNKQETTNNRSSRGWFFTKVLLLPLFVTFLFFLIYAWGNPHFAAFFADFFKCLRKFFEDFSFAHFFFIVGGGTLCGALLRLYRFGLEQYEKTPDAAVRKKRKQLFAGMIALRREVKIGIAMLMMLNLLLLFVNGLDISRVWNHFVVPENFSLKKFVHEGTWVLMFSIFLSMLVLLWLFRGNIHFYKQNSWLKRLAYVWIVQNIFLALSLFKRNYHYIDFHGLAYGRIVVIAFLLLVIVGLITLLIKIKKDRSVFFLHRVNSWAAYFLIVIASFVNWDKLIVNFNLQHSNPGQIDIDYYLAVNGNAFPLVYNNGPVVKQQVEAHRRNPVTWVYYLDMDQFRSELDYKAKCYLEKRAEKTWVSWNLADAQAVAQLKRIKKLR